MKQPTNTMIYNTALYLRLSRDDELQADLCIAKPIGQVLSEDVVLTDD